MLQPLDKAINLGWGQNTTDPKSFFKVTHIIPFYSHTRRRTKDEIDDEKLFGGIDRRVFSNLYEPADGQHLNVPELIIKHDGFRRNLMKHSFLSASTALSSEHFYQAAKCEEECDARFIMKHLSSYDAAQFGHGNLYLSNEMKDTLVQYGADINDFNLIQGNEEMRKNCDLWTRRKESPNPKVREDWYDVRNIVMLHILRHKFLFNVQPGSVIDQSMSAIRSQFTSLSKCLYLVEHSRNDKTWGDAFTGEGSNVLGKTLSYVMMEACNKLPTDGTKFSVIPNQNEYLFQPNKNFIEYVWRDLDEVNNARGLGRISRQKTLKNQIDQTSKDDMVDYLCILDFEATCDNEKKIFPQEIIEFPVLLLNTRTCTIEKTFHHYVKPDIHEVRTFVIIFPH